MKFTIVAVVASVAGLAGTAAAQPLGAEAARTYADFQNLGPHRAFAIAADGKGYLWAGSSGADPAGAVASVLKSCADRSKSTCTLYAVNNIVLNGRDWKSGAGNENNFARKFGPCIARFIESGARQPPCN